MTEDKSWATLREKLLSTPEGQAAYDRARKRLRRRLRWYNRWERAREVVGCLIRGHAPVNKFSGMIICGRCSKYQGRWSR